MKGVRSLLGARPADTAGRAVLLYLVQHRPDVLHAYLERVKHQRAARDEGAARQRRDEQARQRRRQQEEQEREEQARKLRELEARQQAAPGAAAGAANAACAGLHRIAEAQRSGQKCAVVERGRPLDEGLARTCGVVLDDLIVSRPNSDSVAGDVIAILQGEGVWTFTPSGERILPGDVKPPKAVREADRILPPPNPLPPPLNPKVRRKAPSRAEREAIDQEAREEAEEAAAYRNEAAREEAEYAAEVRAVQAPYLASGHRLLRDRDGNELVPGQRLVYYGFLDDKIVAQEATFVDLSRPLPTGPQRHERMIRARTASGRWVSGWPAEFTAPTQATPQHTDDEWTTVQSLPPMVDVPFLVGYKRSQGMWMLAATAEEVRAVGWQVVKTALVWTTAIPPGPVVPVSRTDLTLIQPAPDLDALIPWAEAVHRYIKAHPELLGVDLAGRATFKIGDYTYYPGRVHRDNGELHWRSPRFGGQIDVVWWGGGRELKVRRMVYPDRFNR